ncbi:MAG TPA: DUF3987 domain-containing protein [Dissulfurispiraceae bacterium]|nr:DUF3987 domain-containing protein [Dissulfurispiraceae bacterium]
MRRLKDWLQTYIQYTQFSEAPQHFHFWTGVSVIAGALRRQVWLDMGYFQWTPNFYIILVAPPGIVTKSTTVDIGKHLLANVSTVKFGPSALTWQALIQELQSASELFQTEDGTFYPMSCLNFFVREFGTLVDLQDRVMIDVLVDLWDSPQGTWEKATKMFGRESVANPWINVIAGTTPAWLARNLPREMIGGGFTSRCIFILGERKRHLVPYPSRCTTPEWLEKIKQDLIIDLEAISMLKGPFKLTEEAFTYGEDWYKELYAQLIQHAKTHTDFGGYIARKQSHLHKLAMVISASKRDTLEITANDLRVASKILTALEADLPAIFHSITTTETMEQAGKLVEIVQEKGIIRVTELYQLFFHNVQFHVFQDMLTSAVNAGYVMQKATNDGMFIVALGKAAGIAGAAPSNVAESEVPASVDSGS